MINRSESEVFYNVSQMNKFYQSLKFSKFKNLTPERMAELDSLAIYWRNIFSRRAKNMKEMMAITVERLTISPTLFPLQNNDEILYFYLKTADPEMKCLEIAQLYPEKEERFKYFKTYYGFYDNVIIYLETNLTAKLQEIAINSQTQR